jgi:GNAT superfamily N-acetyltransferase
MGIRVATMRDLDRIMDLGELLHRESPRWSRLSFNRERANATIAAILTGTHGVVYVAEKDGVVVGAIAGVLEQHWSSDDTVAHEISFFMDPAARGGYVAARLICALNAWAKLRGAKWLTAGTSTGVNPEQTAQLYERLGFTRCAIGLEVTYGN